jgi:AcrR family transcriptional regulator
MKTKRSYVMRARAEATAQTRRRILHAALDLTFEKMSLEIVLDDVAQRAEVSVQTILRHFGSRDGLFDALEEFAKEQIGQERAVGQSGDPDTAVRVIFDHYELRGDAVMRMLAQEQWDERTRRISDLGRRHHRQWVAEVFAPQLAARPAPDREELLDLLVVATDVYTWKLLRRDRNLARRDAEARVRQLIAALLVPRKGL